MKMSSLCVFTKENGRMIKHTELEYILMLMDQDMRANGLKTSSMGTELRDGQMELHMKVAILRGKSTAKANLHGLI